VGMMSAAAAEETVAVERLVVMGTAAAEAVAVAAERLLVVM